MYLKANSNVIGQVGFIPEIQRYINKSVIVIQHLQIKNEKNNIFISNVKEYFG